MMETRGWLVFGCIGLMLAGLALSAAPAHATCSSVANFQGKFQGTGTASNASYECDFGVGVGVKTDDGSKPDSILCVDLVSFYGSFLDFTVLTNGHICRAGQSIGGEVVAAGGGTIKAACKDTVDTKLEAKFVCREADRR